ncbi:prepilin-type N-terminal cleavage/methylation domain-containing protein [Vibrio kasasachensis]|uniref:type II secretion system protein n=1 Tax=Vibrio kasasachensis TaxID=2910248 RepID=UPI003D11E2AE
MRVRKQGFTLIELVVVIVILGILAVVAMPKFINLKDDANTAATLGVSGAVHNAVDLAHSKALVEGKQDEAVSEIEGFGILKFGYPAVHKQGLVMFLDLDEGYHDLDKEWVWAAQNHGSVADPDYWIVTRSDNLSDYSGSDFNTEIESTQCYVKYIAAMEAGAEYTIETITDGC